MTRFTLHVPEQLNDGTPLGPESVAAVEERILQRAGGFTMVNSTGAWRDEDTGQIHREPMRLYHIDGPSELGEPIRDLADAIALAFDQIVTYVTEQEITPHYIYPGVTA